MSVKLWLKVAAPFAAFWVLQLRIGGDREHGSIPWRVLLHVSFHCDCVIEL